MVIAAQSYNLTVRFNAITEHTVPLTAIVILAFRLTVVVLHSVELAAVSISIVLITAIHRYTVCNLKL
jgi:hypothetical protein